MPKMIRPLFPCPLCGKQMNPRMPKPDHFRGVQAVKRYRRCSDCNLSVVTYELPVKTHAFQLSRRRLEEKHLQRLKARQQAAQLLRTAIEMKVK